MQNPQAVALAVRGGVVTVPGSLLDMLFEVALSANATMSIVDAIVGEVYLLRIANAGAFTITWPSTVKWSGGAAPTLTSSGVDLVSLLWTGARFEASAVLDLR